MIKVRTRWAWIAALVALAAAQACDPRDDGKVAEEEVAEMETAEEESGDEDRSLMTCTDYCESVMACHDEITEDACLGRCTNYVVDCMGDDEARVLAELEQCAMNPCEMLDACPVGAELECTFGK